MSGKKTYKVREGDPGLCGAVPCERGINFSFAVPRCRKAELVLLNQSGEELQRIELADRFRTGNVAAVFVEDLLPGAIRYHYEADRKKVPDPYASEFSGGECVPVRDDFDWQGTVSPDLAPSDIMIYKFHVRGLTEKAKRGVRHKGTFLGAAEMAGYIRNLGFTAVELMPPYERNEELRIFPFSPALPQADGTRRARPAENYWGYAKENFYFAPKAGFSDTGDAAGDMKAMVRKFHKAGMEVYLEMYFPDGTSPFLAMQAIRMWKTHYRVDGFHCIGGGIPVESIIRDPLLARTKLMFERVDAGGIYGSSIPETKNLFEYNDDFEHTGRAFLKGDEGRTVDIVQKMRRNPATHGVVNYMANVNGFTLFDTVSYNEKHNEANGENNMDGPGLNYSWNCGFEGPTRKKAVRRFRMRQLKNAMLYTFLAQGIPLIMAGDEGLNTQLGNNNAYSSDNEVGWTDWNTGKEAAELRDFVRKLTAFRKAHPIFHMKGELKGRDTRSCGYPDISYHDTRVWMYSYENESRSIGILLDGEYAETEGKEPDAFFFIALNAFWKPHSFGLPQLPKGYAWKPCICSCAPAGEEFSKPADGEALANQQYIEVPERSVEVAMGRPDPLFWEREAERQARKKEEAAAAARRAAEAAGTGTAAGGSAAERVPTADKAASDKSGDEPPAENTAAGPEDPVTAEDTAAGPEDPVTAEDTAVGPEDPIFAEDPAAGTEDVPSAKATDAASE